MSAAAYPEGVLKCDPSGSESERLVDKLDSVFVEGVEGHLIFFFVGHVRVEGTELSFFGVVLVHMGSGGGSEDPVSQIHH